MIRFGGYLGLALLLSGIVLRLLQPGYRSGPGTTIHDIGTAAATAGYALLLLRLGDLAATGERVAQRAMARAGLVGLFALGIGFFGVAMLLSSPVTTAVR